MFVGRKNEIKEISEFLNSPQGLMILYGKRKTTYSYDGSI